MCAQLQLHINQPDAYGRTPLMYTAIFCDSIQPTSQLLQLGAHVMPRDQNNMNASDLAFKAFRIGCCQLIYMTARRRGLELWPEQSSSAADDSGHGSHSGDAASMSVTSSHGRLQEQEPELYSTIFGLCKVCTCTPLLACMG